MRQSAFLRATALLAAPILTLALPLTPLHAQQLPAQNAIPSAILSTSLPEDPSTLLPETLTDAPQFGGPTQSGSGPAVIVNGRPYHRPTPHQELKAYEHDVILGPRPYIRAAIRSGIEQLRTVPIGWGDDFPGYMQRYGSAFGEGAIESSVRYGMGTLFHEDVRYLVCHGCSAGEKIANAALFEVTARHGDDGHRTFSLTPIISSVSGPLVAYAAWYPPGYTPRQALGHVPLNVIIRFAFDLLHEFTADKD